MPGPSKMTYYNSQVLIIRERCFPGPHITVRLSRARKFMDENCFNDIDLQTISGFSFLSKFHFIRLFKNCYGITPHQYLTEKRIKFAKELLGSNQTVIETCYRIGFHSPNSFTAFFRKYTGLSPSEFRKKQFSIGSSRISVPVLSFIKQGNNED